jgi:transposase
VVARSPSVEVITRDRSGAYAEGAKQGAPNAIQVADRFHLLQNLSGAIKQVIDRNPTILRIPAPDAPLLLSAPQLPTTVVPTPAVSIPAPVSAAVQRQRELHQAVQALRQQGQPIRTIAKQLDLAINTVCKYVHLPDPPEPQRRSTRKMLGHEAFVQGQWNAGTRDPKTLFHLLQARGFRGSYQTVARYVAHLRGPLPAAQAVQAPPAPAIRLTVSRAIRALLLPSEKLTDEQRVQLARLRQASKQVDLAYTLAHGFQDMVRQRRADQLPAWLQQVELSGIPSLRGFATSLKKDLDAVTAGLSLPWSNGQVEGQVNRLKQIKRQMYGRGKLDLLKRRVLHYEASP